MTKENNKFAVELCKDFYRAINKKVTPALMRQGIGQFKNLLNVWYIVSYILLNYFSFSAVLIAAFTHAGVEASSSIEPPKL